MSTLQNPLKGIRILSLALNLPGPAALMRCQQMGARCLKVEPPAQGGGSSGDPMGQYNPAAYAQLHQGIRVVGLDLKTPRGLATLHKHLAKTDVLLTSFRPSALDKLGLNWKTLSRQHPRLNQVAIVGSPGAKAEEPGHDLTYLAANGLVTDLSLPPTLYADMGGALMASQAVLQAVLLRQQKSKGVFIEVALSDAAAWAALPRTWGLTLPTGAVGGAHAGYRVYACKDGRVAVAALEPHFAARLCTAAGISPVDSRSLMTPTTRQAIAAFLLKRSCRELDALAVAQDIPLHTLPRS
jgi:alpha-methylacyl-CoA racemase